jgi:hypothetical protein
VVDRPVEKEEEEANNKRRSKDSEKDQRDEREKISTFWGEESFGGRRRTRDHRERERETDRCGETRGYHAD